MSKIDTYTHMHTYKWIRNFLGKVPQGLIEKSLRIGRIKLNNNEETKTIFTHTIKSISFWQIKIL